MYRRLVAAFLALAGTLTFAFATQQQGRTPASKWEAPEEAKTAKNPRLSSPEVLKEGLALYRKNCLTCHGEAGKGDGPAAEFIQTAPANISSPAGQDRMTDGEIFWKITEGRNPMPPFKKKLSVEERWTVVHYVRSLRANP